MIRCPERYGSVLVNECMKIRVLLSEITGKVATKLLLIKAVTQDLFSMMVYYRLSR